MKYSNLWEKRKAKYVTLLAKCFWTAVQGIMEEMAFDKEMNTPDPEWIMAILRK